MGKFIILLQFSPGIFLICGRHSAPLRKERLDKYEISCRGKGVVEK